MPLILCSFFIFTIGVLFFKSWFAGFVSWGLFIIGVFQLILSKDTDKRKADLAYIFENESRSSKSNAASREQLQEIENKPEKPAWNVELFQMMDWKRFEDLCSAYFQESGVRSVQTGLGPDEGIDIYLYEDNAPNPTALVQCKSWTNNIGVALIREFVGVMHHKKIYRGYFITASFFHPKSKEFASTEKLSLIDGNGLVSLLNNLPIETQKIYIGLPQTATI